MTVSLARLGLFLALLPFLAHGQEMAATTTEPVTPFELHGDAPLHCWTLGSPVVFQVSKGALPAGVARLAGTVTDYAGKKVAEMAVDRAKFVAEGWRWTPAQPGYYELEFRTFPDGAAQGESVQRPFYRWSRPDPKGPPVKVWMRTKTYHLAVTAAPARTRENRLAWLGFQAAIDSVQSKLVDDLPLADWLGCGYARLHGIFWGGNGKGDEFALEPQRGVFNWKPLDDEMDGVRKYGFAMVGNIFNTPRWASPHPEETALHICELGYQGYAPADLADWTAFLRKLVGRYGNEIKVWEIWNEPHLPGFSVYWNDTPEHFVPLVKAAYQTIKEVQPDSEIWLGGMAHRYLPFYKAILALGISPYYDRLAIHGSMQGPEGFRVLEKKAGVASKPWVDSEWHAILVGTTEMARLAKPPAEAELTHRMLVDLLFQFKWGAERTTVFQLSNMMEMEVMPIASQYGWYGNVSGLFRKNPCIEPRLAAVALRTLLDQVDKKIAYRAEYDLDGGIGGLRAVVLETGGKPLVAFWSDAPQPLGAVLAKAAGPSARIVDWSGTPVEEDGFRTDPGTIYWIAGADAAAFAGLTPADDVLMSKDGQQKKDYRGPAGTMQDEGRAGGVRWNAADWTFAGDKDAPRPSGLAAKFAVGGDKDGLDLTVEIQADLKNGSWKTDGVRFAIGTDGSGLTGEQVEFKVAEEEGKAVLVKRSAPYIGGDLPARWTPAGGTVQNGSASVERLPGGKTVCKIRLDWGELYPLVREKGEPLSFALVVNGRDSSGRPGRLAWADGIDPIANPGLFGTLRP